jgi:hypothetical protein
MNNDEAKTIAALEGRKLRGLPYEDLRERLLDQRVDSDMVGHSGERYHLQLEAFFDDSESGDLRVVVSVDDGGLRTVWPVTDSFTITTEGRITEHAPAAS